MAGDFPPGTRAIDLPDEAVPSHFLDVFGRPARNSACECERVDAPALGQTLALVSSAEIQEKLTADEGLREAIWRATGKPHATTSATSSCASSPARRGPKSWPPPSSSSNPQTDRKEAYGSLLWSLLATNEFLFNH